MIEAYVFHESVENDFDIIVLSNVLVFGISAVFSKKSISIYIKFKALSLFWGKSIEIFEKFLAN